MWVLKSSKRLLENTVEAKSIKNNGARLFLSCQSLEAKEGKETRALGFLMAEPVKRLNQIFYCQLLTYVSRLFFLLNYDTFNGVPYSSILLVLRNLTGLRNRIWCSVLYQFSTVNGGILS